MIRVNGQGVLSPYRQGRRCDMGEAKLVRFPEDSVILYEGELSLEMYKIISGHAEVYTGYGTDSESVVGIIGKDACFGELGMLLHEPAIFTIKAYSDVYAMRISEEEVGEFMAKNHSSVLNIMRNMAKSMMSMRKQISMLLKEAEEGSRPDQNQIMNATKAMRGYAMYRSIQQAADELQR